MQSKEYALILSLGLRILYKFPYEANVKWNGTIVCKINVYIIYVIVSLSTKLVGMNSYII